MRERERKCGREQSVLNLTTNELEKKKRENEIERDRERESEGE